MAIKIYEYGGCSTCKKLIEAVLQSLKYVPFPGCSWRHCDVTTLAGKREPSVVNWNQPADAQSRTRTNNPYRCGGQGHAPTNLITVIGGEIWCCNCHRCEIIDHN